MRILLLAQVVANTPDSGPRAKTREVLRYLARQHEVTFCAFARSPAEEADAAALRDICRRVVTVPLRRSRLADAGYLAASLLTHDSVLLRRDDRAAMHDAVRQVLQQERIDVVHVDQLTMLRFVPEDWPGTVVLDDHNAVWQLTERLAEHAGDPLRRWLLRREARLLRGVEGAACRRAQLVLAVSPQDRAALRQVAGPAACIETVPIAVDVAQYAPLRATRQPHPNRLLSIGTLFWPPNSAGLLWWLRFGYRQLQARCPDVTYDIVGARPPRALRRCVQAYAGVQLHGYVPDAGPFWATAGALAVPLLAGGGMRVKILAAMALGVPVVSTTIGAEGLAVRHGEHLLLADTPEAFAGACASVLREPALARHLAANAYRLVRERYDTPVALRALDTAYARLTAAAPVTTGRTEEECPCA
jgi:glycosyltransferase involved in cell wall biosynthesis